MNTSNPYAPPSAEADSPMARPGAIFAGAPQPWSVGDALANSFQRVRAQPWPFAVATLLVFGLPQLAAYAPRPFFDLDANGVPLDHALEYFAAFAVAQIVSYALSCYLTAGATKMYLDAARGEDASLGDLFAGFARTPAMMAAMILMMLAIGLGFLCLVIPGIVLTVALSLMPYYVVDAGMGPFSAMAASWRATIGHRWAIFGLGFASAAVLVLGFLFCGVGILFAYPVAYVAQAIVYLRISGRSGVT